MTLSEMSKEYEASAKLLRERLHDLRIQLARAREGEEIWHLKRRIAELTPMLTQMNDLAWMLANYYERSGANHDDRYGFNGIRKSKEVKRETNEDLTTDLARRINRFTEGSILCIPFSEKDDSADCKGTICQQKFSQSMLEASGIESAEIHKVFSDVGESFPRYKKK